MIDAPPAKQKGKWMAAAFFCGRVESRFDGYFLGYVTGSGYS